MPVFVSAHFELDEDVVDQICRTTGCSSAEVSVALVRRRFDGQRTLEFPNESRDRTTPVAPLLQKLDALEQKAHSANELRGERGLKQEVVDTISLIRQELAKAQSVGSSVLKDTVATLSSVRPQEPMKTSSIAPILDQACSVLQSALMSVETQAPSRSQEAIGIAWNSIPPFVYYSQYGNLDSEIYLPHVIENLDRDDLVSEIRHAPER